MKFLVVYYSYTGNTYKLIEQIQRKLNCDVLEIQPVTPYSTDYQQVVDNAVQEIQKNYQPEIVQMNIDFTKYSKIIVATPVWWYSIASPVNTFLHQYDLSNKVVIPLITNGGWEGHAISDIQTLSKAKVEYAISLKFDGKKLMEEAKFGEWLEKISA